MRVIGLTGGIASGKSTVATMLRELGAEVLDADALAREVVEPGSPAWHEVVAAFGREMVAADGALDRRALAARVFAEPEARRRLEGITHPRILETLAARLCALAAAGVAVVIVEAALLVESRFHLGLDGLMVAAAPEESQVERMVQRDGFSALEAGQRLAAQLPLCDKVAAADFVVDCGLTIPETRAQVANIWRRILAGEPFSPRRTG